MGTHHDTGHACIRCQALPSPYHSRSYSYVHPTNPVYLETLWSDGHNSKSIKLMATNKSHQLHMLWQLQVRCLDNFCCLNIIWINKWFCLLRQLSLYHYLGSQTLAEASSTIWGPGTIWGPASARIGGGSVCTIFYWMETSQMENKTRFGKRSSLV